MDNNNKRPASDCESDEPGAEWTDCHVAGCVCGCCGVTLAASNGEGTSRATAEGHPPRCLLSANKRRRLHETSLLVVTGTSLHRSPSTSTAQSIRDFRVRGLCCAPVTPFKENGDINPEVIESYVQHLLDSGVPNIFANGTTGEGNNMTIDERKAMAEAWVKAGKGRLSAIIMHIGAGSLRDTQQLARHAQEIGCDAISCITPTFHKPETMESYVEYMRQVAASAPKLPFYLYDNVIVTGVTFDTNTFFHIAKDLIPTLRGTKHTTPSFVSMHNILMDHGDRFQVLSACEEMYMESMTLGLDVTVMNSYVGNVLNRVRAAFESGDRETTFKEQGRVIRVGNLNRKNNFSIPGGPKAFLRAIGLNVGSPRLPLQPISAETIDVLKQELTDIGYFKWATK